jgi:hypothetical protein
VKGAGQLNTQSLIDQATPGTVSENQPYKISTPSKHLTWYRCVGIVLCQLRAKEVEITTFERNHCALRSGDRFQRHAAVWFPSSSKSTSKTLLRLVAGFLSSPLPSLCLSPARVRIAASSELPVPCLGR